METNAESPGLLQATGCAEHLQRLEDAAAADVERIKFVYREIERRDGSANWHAALWFRFACVLAVGRVAMGVHYPSDVLGGAALGAACALLLWPTRVRRLLNRLADSIGALLDAVVRGIAARAGFASG